MMLDRKYAKLYNGVPLINQFLFLQFEIQKFSRTTKSFSYLTENIATKKTLIEKVLVAYIIVSEILPKT